MNLIEVSEQLKDVPDQYLMQEVQNPTGNYPAYLVISELGRRKRMRESAMKQAPTTTVAEDLTQPQQQPPTGGLNAGLAAAPAAAQSLAAQDVMAQQDQTQQVPVGMAGGGMIYASDGLPRSQFSDVNLQIGDTPDLRFQRAYYLSRGLPLPFELMTDAERGAANPNFGKGPMLSQFESLPKVQRGPASSMGELVSNMFGTDNDMRIDPKTGEKISFGEYMRRKEKSNIAQNIATLPQRMPDTDAAASAREAARYAGQGYGPLAATQAGSQAGSQAAQAPAYRDPLAGLASQNLRNIMGLKAPTEQELATRRATGRSEYEREVPYRFGFLEQDIEKRGKELTSRRESNINEALMQAGLGIMGSKSPRFLQAVSEGGLSALGAYRQGLKDIRSGEEALLNSKTEMAKAQTLYDQGKLSAGEKAEQRGLDAFKRSQDLLNTQNAAIVRNQEFGLKQAEFAQKTPYMDALTQQALANAEFTRSGRGRSGISDADQKAADDFAKSQLVMQGILPGNPKYMEEYKRQYDSYLMNVRGGQPGVGGSAAPVARDRGTL